MIWGRWTGNIPIDVDIWGLEKFSPEIFCGILVAHVWIRLGVQELSVVRLRGVLVHLVFLVVLNYATTSMTA